MKERRREELQPDPKKKSYPELVGNNLYRRRLFDIGVEAFAATHADPGEEIEDHVLAKSWNRFFLVAVKLAQNTSTREGLSLDDGKERIKQEMRDESRNRGLLSDIATPFGLMPFVYSKESLQEKMDNYEKLMPELLPAVLEEIEKELKKPMYPDQIAESEAGRKTFDKGVASIAKRENQPRIRLLPERAFFSALRLARQFPANSGEGSDSWYGYMYGEALNRGLIKEEILEKDRERRMEKELRAMLEGTEQKPPKKGILFRKKKKNN